MTNNNTKLIEIDIAIDLNKRFQAISQFLGDLESSCRKEFCDEKYPQDLTQAKVYWLCKIAENCEPDGSNMGVLRITSFNDINNYSGPISDFYKRSRNYNPSDHIEAARQAGLRIAE